MYVFSQRKTLLQHPTVRRKPTRFRVRICRTFSPCPHVRIRLQRINYFIPRWAASTARVYTRKTHTHLICKDMHGVFRLMFLPNRPSARAKSKIFSAGYIITRNLSCKVFFIASRILQLQPYKDSLSGYFISPPPLSQGETTNQNFTILSHTSFFLMF